MSKAERDAVEQAIKVLRWYADNYEEHAITAFELGCIRMATIRDCRLRGVTA